MDKNDLLVKPDIRKTDKIGFVVAGPMYSGKSLLSHLLHIQYPFFKIKPMAANLKKLVAGYHGISLEELERQKAKYRFDLQWMGTDVMRNHYAEDFWIRLWLNDPEQCGFIVDDIRYLNEYTEIREQCKSVYSIWISAHQDVLKRRCEDKHGVGSYTGTSHSSERGFTGLEHFWDYKIINNYDQPDDLIVYAKNAMNEAMTIFNL